MPPLVYSAILNWNNYADADECLATLVAQTYPAHVVAVIDNGSADDSLGRLRAKWDKTVAFVETGANLGVAEGYNRIIRAGLERGAEYVMTFNNDIAAEPELVATLVDAMEARPDAAAAVPVILYYDDPAVIWFAGARLDRWFGLTRLPLQGAHIEAVRDKLPVVLESDWIVTCATIYRRQAFEDVGLMDRRFFFGHDDVDWSLRARALGWKCLVVGRPLVRHKVGLSAGRRGATVITRRTAFTQAYGSLLVGAKHFCGLRRLTFLAGLLLARAPYAVIGSLTDRRADAIVPYFRGLAVGVREHILGRGCEPQA